jgi:hypothetical protein
MTTDPTKPSFRNSQANWRESTLPLLTKLGLSVRNNLIKLRTRRSCCGNYGEPGC